MKTKSRADSASSNLDGSKRVGSSSSGSPLGGAIELLRSHNAWRRSEHNKQHAPKEIGEAIDLLCLCAEKDAARLDWLQAQEVHRARETGTHSEPFDFLVLAEDGTTCWGKTYREAIDSAKAHVLANVSGQPRAEDGS
ncbi:MAG: hypothetical protein RLZZ15_169 [Verrucomicrobiota bacterium]|jgi:hypothetical protein